MAHIQHNGPNMRAERGGEPRQSEVVMAPEGTEVYVRHHRSPSSNPATLEEARELLVKGLIGRFRSGRTKSPTTG